jgi:hypothetical protein
LQITLPDGQVFKDNGSELQLSPMMILSPLMPDQYELTVTITESDSYLTELFANLGNT